MRKRNMYNVWSVFMLVYIAALLCFMVLAQSTKAATVTVDLSRQTATITMPGDKFTAKVSTGRAGHRTPTGTFRVYRRHKIWYSRKYDNAPMPYALFFHGGYALHTGYVARPFRSHGCVRLPSWAAYRLFTGAKNQPIIVRIVK